MNFLLVVAATAVFLKSSHMDRDKFDAVKKVLFETSQPTTEVASTEPVATTLPADRLAELLAKASGRPAGEQLDFIHQAFDTQMAELDSRQRELEDLKRQIDLARDQTRTDRAKIEQGQKDLADQLAQQTKLESDKGFQDSLELYNVMPAKQVKTIFMTLSDDTIKMYIEAMEPRTAAKIMKEFKLPEEVARIQKVLEKIPAIAAGRPTGGSSAGCGAGHSRAVKQQVVFRIFRWQILNHSRFFRPNLRPRRLRSRSIKKPAKPAHGKSFGQKLDTAKKQIAAKTTDLKPVPVPTKKPVALAAKTPEDPSGGRR